MPFHVSFMNDGEIFIDIHPALVLQKSRVKPAFLKSPIPSFLLLPLFGVRSEAQAVVHTGGTDG